MILNGIMMSTASWQTLLPALTKHFQVICMDFPDQGRSERMKSRYSQSIMKDVVFALLTHLGLSKVNLLGISYGGEVALDFVKTYPDRVERLIISNTTDYTDSHLSAIGESWVAAAKTYDGHFFFKTCMPSIYGKSFYNKENEWLKAREAAVVELLNQEWYEGFIRLVDSAESYDLRGQLSGITHKTLVIGAEDDILTPVECQQRISQQLVNSQMLIICDSGHAPMYEQRTLYETVLIGFLLSA